MQETSFPSQVVYTIYVFQILHVQEGRINPVLRYVILWYTSSYIPMFIIDQIEYAQVGKHCMFKLLRVGFYLKIIIF